MNKRYMRKLRKKLQCSGRRRKEIVRQMTLEVEARIEQGESEEEVLEQMGTPGEIAKEFNAAFSSEEKRKYRTEKWGKIAAVIIGVVLILVAGIYWALPKSYEIGKSKVFNEEEVRAQSEKVISLVGEEDYEALKECSSDKMREFFDGDGLREAKKLFGTEWGAFQGIGNMYVAEVRQMGKSSAVAQFNASYENVSVTYTLVFDENMRLQGLWMK